MYSNLHVLIEIHDLIFKCSIKFKRFNLNKNNQVLIHLHPRTENESKLYLCTYHLFFLLNKWLQCSPFLVFGGQDD